MKLALGADGTIAGHSDCSGGVGVSGDGGEGDRFVPSLSDAILRVSCAGPGAGYLETHGGACFRFQAMDSTSPAGGSGSDARGLTLHWLARPPALDGLAWGAGCKAVDDALASAWSARAYVSSAMLRLVAGGSSGDAFRCTAGAYTRPLFSSS